MPWIVRASPPDPVKPNWSRPWPDSQAEAAFAFARIASAKAKLTRTTREVIWVCGKNIRSEGPVIVRIYAAGKRTFPKGRTGDRDRKSFKNLMACMGRLDSVCNKGLPKDFVGLVRSKTALPPGPLTPEQTEIIKRVAKGRRRKVEIMCPISAAQAESREVAGVEDE